jgi:hypothetical protein
VNQKNHISLPERCFRPLARWWTRVIVFLALFIFVGSTSEVHAQARFSVASGDWNSTSSWSASSGGAPGASVPIATDAVTIERNFTITVDINNAVCASLRVGGLVTGNGTLAFNANTQLTVSGSVILGNGPRTGSLNFASGGKLRIGGALTVTTLGTFTPGTGTVEYYAAGAQTVATTASLGGTGYNNLSLSGSGAKTTTGVTVNGILNMGGSATASAAPTYGAAATLQYDQTVTSGPEWITPFLASGGVVINSGTVTLAANKQLGNNTSVPLNIRSGATLTPGIRLLTFHGDFINAGTLTSGSGGVTIAGTVGTQSIDGFTTTGNVSSTKTAGTATISGNVSAANLTNSGAGTLVLGGSNTLSGTRTVSAGTLTLANTSALGAAGTALTLSGGTLDLMTDASVNAYNITVTATSTISADRATSGAGITHALGTVSIAAVTLSTTVGTNVSSGTAGLSFGNVTFSGGAATTATFNVAAGANVTLGALQTSNRNFAKTNNGQLTLNTAANAARIAGSFTLTAGTAVLGSASALGSAATTLILNGGTLDLMTDASVNGHPTTVGGAAAISIDRATSGAGITHTLGALSIGAFTLGASVGSNVSSGIASLTFGNITFSGGAGTTATFDVAANANVTLGALQTTGRNFAKTNNGQLTLNTAANAARIAGSFTLNAGTAVIGNVSALGSAATTLVLNGGILDLMTDASVNAHPTTVSAAATISVDRATSGAGITHTLGTLSIGAFTLNTTVGTNVSSGTAGLSFGNVTFSGAAGSTATFDVAANANVTLGALQTTGRNFAKANNGQLTLNTPANAARVAGSFTLNGGTTLLGSASALGTIGTTLVLNGGTLDLAVSSTVNAYPTTVGGDAVILSNTATAVPGITHVLGTLSIDAHTLIINKGANATGATATVSFSDLTMTGSAVLSPGSANLLMTGTATGNFKLTKSGVGTLRKTTAGWSLANDFEVAAGIYDANGQTTAVAGLTMVSGGEYQAKTALQTLTNGLSISGGTFTGAAGNVTTGDVTLNSGTLTAPSGSLGVGGNWTNNGATFTAGSGSVSFSGASQTIGGSASTTFNNLTLGGTAAKNASVGINIAGALTVNQPLTMGGSNVLTMQSTASQPSFASLTEITGTMTWQATGASAYTFNNSQTIVTFTGADASRTFTLIVKPGTNPTGYTAGNTVNRYFSVGYSNWSTGTATLQAAYLQAEASDLLVTESALKGFDGGIVPANKLPGAPAHTVSTGSTFGFVSYAGLTSADLPAGEVAFDDSFSAFFSVLAGAWNVASTWDAGIVPSSADDVVIDNNFPVSIPNGYAAAAKSVTINATATSLTVGAGVSGSLSVGTGGLTNNSTGPGLTVSSGAIVTITGASLQNAGTITNNGTIIAQ